MAEENQNQKSHEYEPTVGSEGAVESKDRGLFDFLGKKEEEKPQHHQQQGQAIVTEFEKAHVSEPKVEEHKGSVGAVEEGKLFDFMGKKEEEKPQHQDQAMATEFEKVHVSEPKIEEHKGSEGAVEGKDRGLFGFMGKKEEEKPQHQDQSMATEFEKVHVSEPKVDEYKEEQEKEEKKPGILEKLHRPKGSSSSSSSDEEEGDDEEKKKKKKEKKGLKETLKEKLAGDKGEEKHETLKEKLAGDKGEEKHEDATVPVERVDEVPHHQEPAHPEEKKGFLDKVKEKIPGQHKKPEAEAAATIPETHRAEHAATAEAHDSHEGEVKEKKGIFEKIKEKLPGYHPKTEEEKEKEKGSSAH